MSRSLRSCGKMPAFVGPMVTTLTSGLAIASIALGEYFTTPVGKRVVVSLGVLGITIGLG